MNLQKELIKLESWDKFYKMGLSKEKSDFSLDFEFKKIIWQNSTDIEVSADDKNFTSTKSGIFYNGQRVILYIRDQIQYFEDKTTQYKFHIIGCSTLKSMMTQKRYEKYVVTNDTSGIFKVHYIRNNNIVEAETRLHVCKNCLNMLNWKGYKRASAANRLKIYENFSIEEFFRSFENDNKKNWGGKNF